MPKNEPNTGPLEPAPPSLLPPLPPPGGGEKSAVALPPPQPARNMSKDVDNTISPIRRDANIVVPSSAKQCAARKLWTNCPRSLVAGPNKRLEHPQRPMNETIKAL